MVKYPLPTLAPPGVARLQACVITRSPTLTSSARAGATSKLVKMAHASTRMNIAMIELLQLCYGQPARLVREISDVLQIRTKPS
jgi:hypothetical protein